MAYNRQVFISPPDKREEARAAKLRLTSTSTAAAKSDHIAIIAAFNTWNKARRAGGKSEAVQAGCLLISFAAVQLPQYKISRCE